MSAARRVALLCSMLAFGCASAMAADTLLVRYTTTGPNAGFPHDTLNVYQSGNAELISAQFNSTSRKPYTLTPTELSDLKKLFSDNNYSSLDSNYQSGCLACAEYSIFYGNKRVRGNTTGGNTQLANIKAGLDALVTKIQNSTTAIGGRADHAIHDENTFLSSHARLDKNGGAGHSGLVAARRGLSCVYSVAGRREAAR